MKLCTKCGIEKAKAEFSKSAGNKDGLKCHCRACAREYYKANAERLSACRREYYKANAEKIAERMREYYKANSEKIAEQQQEYYKANSEKIAERQREYRNANPEKIAEWHREYNKANAEKVTERKREYRKANPEKCAAMDRNRRARKQAAEGSHTAADIRAIFEGQRGLCASCETKLFKSGTKKYHVDHIMPLALGGSNWPANLQCLCPACNLSKGAKHPDDWKRENWRLI